MRNPPFAFRAYPLLSIACLAALLAGCGQDPVRSSTATLAGPGDRSPSVAREVTSPGPPVDIATVEFGGRTLHLWPYTGRSFDGTPSDPINLIFVGKGDPRAIRAALLALDGDRTGIGYPDDYPFNATWSDANGDVQTAYADGEGWVGNVIQLQLGRYEFGRVHLRLFRTGSAFGEGGVWTLGGAHFEILIPGTADHQVLSWEVARQLVVVDLMRTGLLDATVPVGETGVISAAPAFRDIPAVIYNGLPDALRALIGGPPAPVSDPVGILSSGKATILNLAGAAPVTPGGWSDAFTLNYDIVAPKPFCNGSGDEYVHLSGPVTLGTAVTVDEDGLLSYSSSISGRLQVTPVDVTSVPPAPTGKTYFANVNDESVGLLSAGAASVQSMVKRIGTGDRGAQLFRTRLRVGTYGTDSYREEESCLGPGEAGTSVP